MSCCGSGRSFWFHFKNSKNLQLWQLVLITPQIAGHWGLLGVDPRLSSLPYANEMISSYTSWVVCYPIKFPVISSLFLCSSATWLWSHLILIQLTYSWCVQSWFESSSCAVSVFSLDCKRSYFFCFQSDGIKGVPGYFIDFISFSPKISG